MRKVNGQRSTDDGRQTTDDWRQVMTKAHVAIGKVSSKTKRS
jgi:hypothetical protein